MNWLNAVAFSPDGTTVAAGTADASVLVWNLATRSLTATLPHPQPVTSLAWDGTGRLAAGDADGTVSHMDAAHARPGHGNAPSGVAYSPDGTTLAVGGQNVQLWDAVRRTLIATRPLPAGTITNAIAYSPDGDLIAIARSDGTAWLLDARTLAPVGQPFRVTATGNAESVAFSPDGKLLATAADDGTLRLWSLADPARPRQLASVHDSGTYVYTVVFAPDGRTIAAASTDNLTRLWNVADPARPVLLGRPLTGPTSYVIGLAFSPDSRLLAVGSADKTVRLWDVSRPRAPGPGRGAADRADRLRLGGGVQPRRQHAGRGRHRRHRVAVEPRRPGPSGPDRHPHRAGRARVLHRVLARPAGPWPPPATTAPCTCGTPARRRPWRTSAPTRASSSPGRNGPPTSPAWPTARPADPRGARRPTLSGHCHQGLPGGRPSGMLHTGTS